MKVLKKLLCCASYSIICSNAVIGANPLQMPAFARLAGKQAVTSVRQSLAIARAPTTTTTSYSWLTLRNQESGWNNKGSKRWVTNESPNFAQQSKENTEDLLEQLRILTEVLVRQTQLLTQSCSTQQSAPPKKTTPKPVLNAECESTYGHEEVVALNADESSATLVKYKLHRTPDSPMEQREPNKNDYSSYNVIRMREQFIDQIMLYVKVPNLISRQDVIPILDLYAALPNRSIEGITKVLNGQVNSHKSSIYTTILKELKTRDFNLHRGRKTYHKLSEAFGEDAMQVLSKVSEKMMNEKRNRMDNFIHTNGKNMTEKESIEIIVDCAHPVYPLEAHEVEVLVKVYTSFSDYPQEVISKVLSGQVNNHKNLEYTALLLGLKTLGLNLHMCRKIYAKLSYSGNGNAKQVLLIMLANR